MSARSNGHAPGFSPFVSPAELLASYEAPEWLVEGILQTGRLYSLTSLTNHGKTAIAAPLTISVQSGRKFAGLDVVQGNTLYLAGENFYDLQGRMVGARLHSQQSPLPLAIRDLPHVFPRAMSLDAQGLERLMDDIKAFVPLPLALIVIDTAAAFFPMVDNRADDNSNVQQGEYARGLRLLCELPGLPTVLVLCHPTKNATRDELVPRGGGGFINEVDGNLTVWKEGELATLHWQHKLRGAPFDPLVFKFVQVPTGKLTKRGTPDMTVIAEAIGDFELVDRQKLNLTNQRTLLKLVRDNPDWSHTNFADYMGLKNAKGKSDKSKIQDYMSRLYKDKLVKRVQGVYQVTKAGKDFLTNSKP